MGGFDGQSVSTLEHKNEEIELAPSNLQLFLVCLGILALFAAFFAAGYQAGKKNPHLKTASERVIPGFLGHSQDLARVLERISLREPIRS
jgi:hypothetical protein